MDSRYAQNISVRPDGRGGVIISIYDRPDSAGGRMEEVRLNTYHGAQLAGQIIDIIQTQGEEYLSASLLAKELGITRQAVESRVRSGTMPTPDIEVRNHRGKRGEVTMRYWTRRALRRVGVLRERGSGDVGIVGGLFWLLMLFYLFFG
jgi:biotin operon repressor